MFDKALASPQSEYARSEAENTYDDLKEGGRNGFRAGILGAAAEDCEAKHQAEETACDHAVHSRSSSPRLRANCVYCGKAAPESAIFASRILSFPRVTPTIRRTDFALWSLVKSTNPFSFSIFFAPTSFCGAISLYLRLSASSFGFPGTSLPPNSRHVRTRMLGWNQPKSALNRRNSPD